MSNQDRKGLRGEIKELINLTHHIVDEGHDHESESFTTYLDSFAQKIHNIHHFSNELIRNNDTDESTSYNLQMLKTITESPIYSNTGSKESTSLLSAADALRKEQKREKMDLIFNNLVKDPKASAVLFDDLMVIYKELAA